MLRNSYKFVNFLSESPLTLRYVVKCTVCSFSHIDTNLTLTSPKMSYLNIENRKLSSRTNRTDRIRLRTLKPGGGGVGNPNIILEKASQLAVQIFHKAVESVKPPNLLKKKIYIDGDNVLRIDDGNETSVDLNCVSRIFVVGFGKAVLPMAEEVMKILGNKVERCIVNIPEGFRKSKIDKIEINRGAHNNIPDKAAYDGTQKIVQLVKECRSNDLLIVLISGGGSALLPYPKSPITLQEKSNLVKELSRAGASIEELNSVRKRLSQVKGGGLIDLCPSSRIISLILSDVLGDPLDVIASGPTVPNPDPPSLAKEIVAKYIKSENIPENISKVLNDLSCPCPSSSSKTVTNSIIGNNSIALETAAEAARKLNLYPFILTNTLSGDAAQVGGELGNATQAISYLFRARADDEYIYVYRSTVYLAAERLGIDHKTVVKALDKVLDREIRNKYEGVCFLLGGETTVKVTGKGVGGRNQELALTAGIRIDSGGNCPHVEGKVALLSGGTDGFDGPCAAAGAVVDTLTLPNGYVNLLSPNEHLIENNSYNYFRANTKGAYHIITGHTETNVMDLVIIVVVK